MVSWVTMLCGFARNGQILEARRFFNLTTDKNVVSWNATISAYVQNSQTDEAVKLFTEMPMKNAVSWTTMINGYVCVGMLKEARHLLDTMPYKNVGAQTAMISGYVQNKKIDDAHKIFNLIRTRDVVCWNTMIKGYAQCGNMNEAFSLFKQMVQKDIVTWNTMIAGYAQVGEMDSAVKMFKKMGERNIVSWNSLISGFTQNGLFVDALKSFVLMVRDGKKPDQSTFASGLSSCANLAALQVGKQFHQIVTKSGYAKDLFVSNALISMYAKCGEISSAENFFCGIGNVDVISWNSMIAGYALNGCGKEAVKLFKDMELKGVAPDQVTFVGVLSACSHAGFIDQGLDLFECMTEKCLIEPLAEHYACMVDLLGRAGRLEEAFKLVRGIKIKANAGVWGALLGACRIHKNVELAKLAAMKLFELEPDKTSNYVLLSNIHADSGRWNAVQRVRVSMNESRAEKQPGCSWIEDKNQVLSFLSDDGMQLQNAEIYYALKTLTTHISNSNNLPDIKPSVLDVG